MDILLLLQSIYSNIWTYVIMIVLGLGVGARFIPKLVKKSPVYNKRNLMIAGILGVLFVGGIFGAVSFGSVAGSGLIIDSQITTSFATDAGGSVAVSTTYPNTIDVRLTDAQSNETATYEELTTGVIRLKRGGDLSPMSCDVTARVPSDYLNQDGSDQTTLYHLVERNSLGEIEVYLAGASSTTAGALTDPKGVTSLPFGDGVDTAYLGIMIEIDEEGHDAMNQYESLPVIINACGEIYTINFFRMD